MLTLLKVVVSISALLLQFETNLQRTYLASHSKRSIDSVMNHHEKAWPLAYPILMESSLFVASEKSAFLQKVWGRPH